VERGRVVAASLTAEGAPDEAPTICAVKWSGRGNVLGQFAMVDRTWCRWIRVVFKYRDCILTVSVIASDPSLMTEVPFETYEALFDRGP
jgi:hypothetical protein